MKALLCLAPTLAMVISSGAVWAEEKKPEPLVRLTGATVTDGMLSGNTMRSVTQYISQTEMRIVDGQQQTVTVLVPIVKEVLGTITYSLKGARVTDLDGKEIAADDLAATVKDAKVIAVFRTASKPTAEAVKKMPKGTVLFEIVSEKK